MLKLFLGIGLFLCLTNTVEAAKVSFNFSNQNLSVGDTVNASVYLDTEGQSINAVDLGVLYPGIFRVKKTSKSGSFIQLWVQEPSFTSEAVFFAGGLPGGVSGNNKLIGTITFEARAVGDGAVGLSPSSNILINDGEGSAAHVTVSSPKISVTARSNSKKSEAADSSKTQKQEHSDIKAPERFNLTIGKDVNVFGGQYFISFFTFDSGSGIDHYTIKEGKNSYKIARSPYLLTDQELHTAIRVRAYDSSGNYREKVYPGFLKRVWWAITAVFGSGG